jgi:predicted GNAT family N-acyltransferase
MNTNQITNQSPQLNINPAPLEMRQALSALDLEACYRLRHLVFVEELGQNYQEQERGVLRDEWDSRAIVLAAFRGSRAIATCRFNVQNLESHPDFWDFGLKKFKQGTTALGSKIVTHPEARDGMVFLRFMRHLFSWLVEHGYERNALGCQAHLIPLYQKFGYRSCGPAVERPGVGLVYPLVLEHFDIEHLAAVRSPFLTVAKSFQRKGLAS